MTRLLISLAIWLGVCVEAVGGPKEEMLRQCDEGIALLKKTEATYLELKAKLYETVGPNDPGGVCQFGRTIAMPRLESLLDEWEKFSPTNNCNSSVGLNKVRQTVETHRKTYDHVCAEAAKKAAR